MHDGITIIGSIISLAVSLTHVKLILAAGCDVVPVNCDILIPISAGMRVIQANSMKHLKTYLLFLSTFFLENYLMEQCPCSHAYAVWREVNHGKSVLTTAGPLSIAGITHVPGYYIHSRLRLDFRCRFESVL